MLVIRYEGPRGGPGMREMLSTTAALYGQGGGDNGRAHHRRALLRRHARLLHRPCRARRRRSAGRSACCSDGDIIAIDAVAGTLAVELSDAELAERRKALEAAPARVPVGRAVALRPDRGRRREGRGHPSRRARRSMRTFDLPPLAGEAIRTRSGRCRPTLRVSIVDSAGLALAGARGRDRGGPSATPSRSRRRWRR